MSKQKPMTRAELAKVKKQREKLKDAPKEMRSGSFKINRHGEPFSRKPPKKKQKDKLKIGG